MTKLAISLKKSAMAALAASVVAAGATALTTTSAEAQFLPGRGFGAGVGPRFGGGPRFAPAVGPRYGYGARPFRRGPNGAAVAAGIVGGLAAGAIIAGAVNPGYAAPAYDHPGYVPAPAYGYAQPTYVQPGYGYEPTCYTRRVRQVVDYDTVVIRRVRVCE
jgi:hypothetical protein